MFRCAGCIAIAVVCTCALGAADAPPPPPLPPRLVAPNGLALDRDGNLFISDIATHQVYKLDNAGRLTVIAGTGDGGFAGDGGPAVEAKLSSPSDLTFDADGNLYIADTFNHRIRRIDSAGVISTVVGDGKDVGAGAAETAPSTALEVSLNNPQGIALDRDGNLYVADTFNHVIRRIDRQGAATVVAGSQPGLHGDGGPATQAQLNGPQAVAVASDGLVYISDANNSRIRRVGPDGKMETVAGNGPGSGLGGAGFTGDGGPAAKAKLFAPADLEFNALGQLYVSDTGNSRIRLIAHASVTTVAGDGSIRVPQKIAVTPGGSVFIADRARHRVVKLDSAGTVTTVAGEEVAR